MLRRGIFEIVRGANDLARLLERVLDFACGEQRSRCCVLGKSDRDPRKEREHSYQVIVFMVGVNQAELVVVHHGGVERTNRARESAGCESRFLRHIQMKHSAHTVEPCHALQSEGFLAQRVHSHHRNAVLDGLLEDVWLCDLDEGRVDGRRRRKRASWRLPGSVTRIVGSHAGRGGGGRCRVED